MGSSRVEKINRSDAFKCYGFRVYLDKPLYGRLDPGFADGSRLSVSNVSVASAGYDSALQAIVMYTSADIDRTLPVTITMPEHRGAWYYRLPPQRWFLPALTAVAEPEAREYFTFENEAATIAVINAQMWIDDAVFAAHSGEADHAGIFVTLATVTLEPISSLPI